MPKEEPGYVYAMLRRLQLLKRRLHVYAVAGWMKWSYSSADREADALPRHEKKRDAAHPEAKLPVHPDFQAEEDAIYERTHTAILRRRRVGFQKYGQNGNQAARSGFQEASLGICQNGVIK